MEIAEELAQKNCELQLQWIRRDINQLADDLTNEEFKGFDSDQRIDLRAEDFQWRILDRLLAHADSFYRELGTRKREAPVPKFGRKATGIVATVWPQGVSIKDGNTKRGMTLPCTVTLVRIDSSKARTPRAVLRFAIREGWQPLLAQAGFTLCGPGRNRQIRRMCKSEGLMVEWLLRTRIGPVYVPELVFGHLLTSDNYDDSSCKVVGGRNGYGAKLANVFSTEFKVETCDGKNRFSQLYKSNMQVKGKPEIEKSFTCITFKPDLAKFGMAHLDDALLEDIVSLLTKRVYDVAGSTAERCSVFLNGDKLDVKNFRDYCDLYLLTRQGVPQIYEKCSDRWEICVSLTETGFHQVSFVNSICTIRGGTHVAHVSDQVVEAILEKVRLQSKEKVKGGVDVRPHHVKNHLWIFIKCLVENPAFDSQTKETSGHPTYDLEYADDTLLTSLTTPQLQQFLSLLEEEAARYGMLVKEVWLCLPDSDRYYNFTMVQMILD
eukprot:s3770_g6.t1